MEDRDEKTENTTEKSSKTLLIVILVIMESLIAAFLLLRPSPAGSHTSLNRPTATSSAPPGPAFTLSVRAPGTLSAAPRIEARRTPRSARSRAGA